MKEWTSLTDIPFEGGVSHAVVHADEIWVAKFARNISAYNYSTNMHRFVNVKLPYGDSRLMIS